jgi:hypothetical protein
LSAPTGRSHAPVRPRHYGGGSATLDSLDLATGPTVCWKYSTTTVRALRQRNIGGVRGWRLIEPAVDDLRAIHQHPDSVVSGHAEAIGARLVVLRPGPARRAVEQAATVQVVSRHNPGVLSLWLLPPHGPSPAGRPQTRVWFSGR